MFELKRLSPDDGTDIYNMLQDIPKEENGLQNKANGLTYEEFKEWLIKKQAESEQEGIVDGWKVPSTTYWLYVDGVPVGYGSVRKYLTEALRKAGGHIGYGIAPSYRGKGYGKELLRLLLLEASKVGISKCLLTIHKDNFASQAVARANGGLLSDETDERVYYWINCNLMIQEIKQEDISQCVEVIRKSFATVANEFGITKENGARFTAFATDENRINWHMFGEHRPMYGYYENDKLIGYYSLLIKDNGECELNNLSVLPEYRHNQIGYSLLAHSFEKARELGCTKMHIGIVEENTVLRSWYEKYGFVHTGAEKYDFFPFTCGYMEKELSANEV